MSSHSIAPPPNGQINQALTPEFEDESLSLALRLSHEEALRQEAELRREREMIEEAIRLSLQEN